MPYPVNNLNVYLNPFVTKAYENEVNTTKSNMNFIEKALAKLAHLFKKESRFEKPDLTKSTVETRIIDDIVKIFSKELLAKGETGDKSLADFEQCVQKYFNHKTCRMRTTLLINTGEMNFQNRLSLKLNAARDEALKAIQEQASRDRKDSVIPGVEPVVTPNGTENGPHGEVDDIVDQIAYDDAENSSKLEYRFGSAPEQISLDQPEGGDLPVDSGPEGDLAPRDNGPKNEIIFQEEQKRDLLKGDKSDEIGAIVDDMVLDQVVNQSSLEARWGPGREYVAIQPEREPEPEGVHDTGEKDRSLDEGGHTIVINSDEVGNSGDGDKMTNFGDLDDVDVVELDDSDGDDEITTGFGDVEGVDDSGEGDYTLGG